MRHSMFLLCFYKIFVVQQQQQQTKAAVTITTKQSNILQPWRYYITTQKIIVLIFLAPLQYIICSTVNFNNGINRFKILFHHFHILLQDLRQPPTLSTILSFFDIHHPTTARYTWIKQSRKCRGIFFGCYPPWRASRFDLAKTSYRDNLRKNNNQYFYFDLLTNRHLDDFQFLSSFLSLKNCLIHHRHDESDF